MPTIATNSAANTALLNLNKNSMAQETYLTQLSSGSRINKSSDDAAGLAVSDQIQADITTLEQSGRNTEQGQSLLQTADGALSRISDILQRQQSLATQYNGGTLDDTSRGFIEEEYQALNEQIDLIVSSTTFNGVNLIDGTYNETFIVGSSSADRIDVDLSGVNASSTALGLPTSLTEVGSTNLLEVNLQTATGAAEEDTLITDLTTGFTGATVGNTITLNVGGLALSNNTFTVAANSTVGALANQIDSITDAATGERLFDASLSSDGTLVVELIDGDLLDGAATNIQLVTVGIGVDNATSIDRDDSGARDDVNGAAGTFTLAADGDAGLANLQDDIQVINDAIATLSTSRSTVGAFTSRFESQGENIETQILNLTDAKSAIVDVDIAEAQTNFTNAQVLTEAATAALAQANQMKSSLLTLLR